MGKLSKIILLIEQMVEKIPKEELELLKSLEGDKQMASKEILSVVEQGFKVILTLQKHIPHPTLEWHFEILSIFSETSIKRLKEIAKEHEF